MKSTLISAPYKAYLFAITSDCLTRRATETYMRVTFYTISDDQELVQFTFKNNTFVQLYLN